jgi:hypothetical protein
MGIPPAGFLFLIKFSCFPQNISRQLANFKELNNKSGPRIDTVKEHVLGESKVSALKLT